MELLLLGAVIGGIFGVATTMLILSRQQEEVTPEWADLLAEQQGHIPQFQKPLEEPRAVTRLTNRERTITL